MREFHFTYQTGMKTSKIHQGALQEGGRGTKELKNFHAVIKPLGVCNK